MTIRKLSAAVLGVLILTAAAPAAAVEPIDGLLAGVPDPVDTVLPSEATASIDVHEARAGIEQAFTITVSHPSMLGPAAEPIDLVVVTLPDGLATALGGDAPGGWTSEVIDEGAAVEFSGGTLTPDSPASFSVTAHLDRPAADTTGTWRVDTSTDGGTTLAPATTEAAGDLDTTVRVLEVSALRATAPAEVGGEVPLSVSAGQAFEVTATIDNGGSGPLDVTPTVTGGGSTFVPPTSPVTIPAGTSVDVAFAVTLPAAGTVNLVADASAPGDVDGISEQLGVVVMAPLTVADAGDLSPTKVAPGEPYTFSLDVTVDGGVVADLDPTTSTVTFGSGAITAGLASPPQVSGPGSGTTTLTFGPVVIPDVPGGTYTGTVHLDGTDENGMTVSISFPLEDTLQVDLEVPAATPTITPPPARVGDEPALADGIEATIGGAVVDGGMPCGGCTVVDAQLEQFDEPDGVIVVSTPVAVTNTNGALGGSILVDRYAPTATAARLAVTVRDEVGEEAVGYSGWADVDTQGPTIASFVTGGSGGENDLMRIDGVFSEPAVLLDPAGKPLPVATADFSCGGHTVVAAQLATDRTSVQLTLAVPLVVNETPTCSYEPPAQRLIDRVDLPMMDVTVLATDGIAPLAVAIDEVDGRESVDGIFHTNQTEPLVSVSGTESSDIVEVIHDANGDGAVDAGDAVIGSEVAAGTTADVQLDDLGMIGDDFQLLTRATDAAGNKGPVTPFVLRLDVAPPTLGAATATDRTVTVPVSELLVPSVDQARDWRVVADDRLLSVSAASRSDGAETTFTLTVDDPAFDPATMALTEVRYRERDAASRYEDLAGNGLADSSTPISST